jgi:hypothetical protein
MELIIVYVILMVIGDLIDFGIGFAASRMWSDAASMPIFLGAYFLTLWIAWFLAVKITEPKNWKRLRAR